MDVEVQGTCPDRFARVRETFQANFHNDLEHGARFSLAIEGEIVIDLWAGYADRKKTVPFTDRTLTPVFSTTKAVTSLVVARAVGQGLIDYRQPVAELWPEFAQAGKGAITVEQCLSHQDGLAAFVEPMEASLWFDWDAVCARLAAMAPLWAPGTASGYHPVTFGYTAGEIFRRAGGRTIGKALRADFAEPLGEVASTRLITSARSQCSRASAKRCCSHSAAPKVNNASTRSDRGLLSRGSSVASAMRASCSAAPSGASGRGAMRCNRAMSRCGAVPRGSPFTASTSWPRARTRPLGAIATI